jgi:hypothetical protein
VGKEEWDEEGKRRRARRGGEVKKKIFNHQALTGKG